MMATPPARLLPTPKPASARRRPVVVKVHKKYELLGEVQVTFAIIQLKQCGGPSMVSPPIPEEVYR